MARAIQHPMTTSAAPVLQSKASGIGGKNRPAWPAASTSVAQVLGSRGDAGVLNAEKNSATS